MTAMSQEARELVLQVVKELIARIEPSEQHWNLTPQEQQQELIHVLRKLRFLVDFLEVSDDTGALDSPR
jgi:hypothetical protein